MTSPKVDNRGTFGLKRSRNDGDPKPQGDMTGQYNTNTPEMEIVDALKEENNILKEKLRELTTKFPVAVGGSSRHEEELMKKLKEENNSLRLANVNLNLRLKSKTREHEEMEKKYQKLVEEVTVRDKRDEERKKFLLAFGEKLTKFGEKVKHAEEMQHKFREELHKSSDKET